MLNPFTKAQLIYMKLSYNSHHLPYREGTQKIIITNDNSVDFTMGLNQLECLGITEDFILNSTHVYELTFLKINLDKLTDLEINHLQLLLC